MPTSRPICSSRKRAATRSADARHAGLDPGPFLWLQGGVRGEEHAQSIYILFGLPPCCSACGQSRRWRQPNQAAANRRSRRRSRPIASSRTARRRAGRRRAARTAISSSKARSYRSDSRYKAVLNPPVVTGTSAEIAPTITINDTGLRRARQLVGRTATIPNSAAGRRPSTSAAAREELAEFNLRPKADPARSRPGSAPRVIFAACSLQCRTGRGAPSARVKKEPIGRAPAPGRPGPGPTLMSLALAHKRRFRRASAEPDADPARKRRGCLLSTVPFLARPRSARRCLQSRS